MGKVISSRPIVPARRWSEIERAMERARDLRSATCAAFAASALRCLGRLFSRGRGAAPLTLRRAGAVGLAHAFGLAAMPDGVRAQEAKEARLAAPGGDADGARLAALGIDAASIETIDDAAILWRAVRELVLPGRLSEPMQQRILRRVWIADRDIRDAPASDSMSN